MKKIIQNRSKWSDIWSRFQTGDRYAFSEIYETFIDSLFAYGIRITRDREMVKDCIHDLFIDLQRLKPDLFHPDLIEFYLFKSLKNALIHKLEENKKINILPFDELLNFDLQFNLGHEISENESERLRITKLKSILASLDPQKRELLFLKFSTGLTYSEIGQLLGMNPDTVKKQVYRTLDRLRCDYKSQLLAMLVICNKWHQ